MEDHVHIYCKNSEYPQLYKNSKEQWEKIGKYIKWLNMRYKWAYIVGERFRYTNSGFRLEILKCQCKIECDEYKIEYQQYAYQHLTTFTELDDFVKYIIYVYPETKPYLAHLKTKIYELDGEKYIQAKLAIEPHLN